MRLTEEALDLLRRRVASTSVGPSTVRGYVAGTVAAARAGLVKVDLQEFCVSSQDEFCARLNKATIALRKRLPDGAQCWGLARKVMNIYLRGAFYNRYIVEKWQLAQSAPWLEVPVDSHVARGLRLEDGGECLPRWTRFQDFDHRANRAFQDFASIVARKKKILRVHLDLYYWRDLRNAHD